MSSGERMNDVGIISATWEQEQKNQMIQHKVGIKYWRNEQAGNS